MRASDLAWVADETGASDVPVAVTEELAAADVVWAEPRVPHAALVWAAEAALLRGLTASGEPSAATVPAPAPSDEGQGRTGGGRVWWFRAGEAGAPAPYEARGGDEQEGEREARWAVYGRHGSRTRPAYIVTRPWSDVRREAVAAERMGLRVVPWPLSRAVPAPQPAAVLSAIADLAAGRFAAVAFVSARAVEGFFASMEASLALDARVLHGTLVAAVGQATARALAAHGIRADAVGGMGGAALARTLLTRLPPAGRVLVVGAAEGHPDFEEVLTGAGQGVVRVAAYAMTDTPLAAWAWPEVEGVLADRKALTYLACMSPAAVRRVRTALGEAPQGSGVRLVAVGSTTLREGRVQFPEAVWIRADEPSTNGILSAIRRDLAQVSASGR